MLRGLTFDLWQTLIYDTRDSARTALRAEGFVDKLGALGYRFSTAEVLAAMEACAREHDTGDPEKEFLPLSQVGWILRRLGVPEPELARAQSAAFAPFARAALTVPPEVFPEAASVVGALAEKYPLALICNTGATPGSVLRVLLERFGLLDHFRVLIFSDEIGYRKPSSLVFRAGVDALGVRPGEAAHIGDNPFTDVHGAKRIGMRAILLSGGRHSSRPYRHPGEAGAPAPDAIAGSLAELPAAVDVVARRIPP